MPGTPAEELAVLMLALSMERAISRGRVGEVGEQVDVHVERDQEGFVFGCEHLARKREPESFSSGRTFVWLPLVSSRMPMVRGRFFSCVMFLMVCGSWSSATWQSSLRRLETKPFLSRTEK